MPLCEKIASGRKGGHAGPPLPFLTLRKFIFSHERAQKNTKETRLEIFPFLFQPENRDWLWADFAKASSSRTLDFAEAHLVVRL
jgi:hypothetical protein